MGTERCRVGEIISFKGLLYAELICSTGSEIATDFLQFPAVAALAKVYSSMQWTMGGLYSSATAQR